ncbi:hypothetical protein BN6_15130 [Saccharothrix espanaensis DSM 44229]|uniref:Uncharacterized protein n=1 Tax=Saccharothrix espanaensis (strain ATCC 51144 / DSM 44229 / JCM 9112 / NBRC 15066 / NRRL 15764) TaxID=1179773 RepID=K0JTG3_SACES|nr:hypothetical protein BN6_15130 [Saccharothrix espanaensis DSM 44229]
MVRGERGGLGVPGPRGGRAGPEFGRAVGPEPLRHGGKRARLGDLPALPVGFLLGQRLGGDDPVAERAGDRRVARPGEGRGEDGEQRQEHRGGSDTRHDTPRWSAPVVLVFQRGVTSGLMVRQLRAPAATFTRLCVSYLIRNCENYSS